VATLYTLNHKNFKKSDENLMTSSKKTKTYSTYGITTKKRKS